MNKYKLFSKMWFIALLLVAFVAGCASNSAEVIPGTLVSISITPPLASIPVTGTQQYTLTAIYNDGTSHDVTAVSTWAAVNVPLGGAAVATVLPTGVATGNAIGQSSISATYLGKTATATLTVNAATSVSFRVTPALASIPVTGTQQYTAVETFSDGTTFDRTAASTWSAANVPLSGAAVATVSTTLPTKGLATGNAIGQSSISATFGALSNSVTLTVNAATSKGLKLSPTTASIPVTGNQQYTLIEIFSDGTSQPRTTDLATSWATSNNSGNVSLTSSGLTAGLASGLIATPAGTPVTISASYGGNTVTATLTVNAATSKGLRLSPSTASIPVTGNQQYTLLEIFSDGTSQLRTTDAATTWVLTNNTGNISLTPSGLTAGLASGLIATPAGTPVTITASYGGNSVTATLTVNAATSKGLRLSPATASIPVTATQQYTLLEIFSDGTSQQRTTDVATIWTTSNNTGNVSLTPSGLTAGLASGLLATPAGTPVTISATYGGNTVTADLTVNAATSVSFKVTPLTATISINGGGQQFAAIETFSDGSTFDRTTNVATTWSAVDLTGGPGVSTIGLNTGIATGAVIGTSTITATYTVGLITKTGTAVLTVTAPDPGAAGAAPNLKTAAPFGILAYNAISNSAGPSHIYGDVALTQPGPGGTIASVTGSGTNDGGSAPLMTSTMVTTSAGVSPGMITAANNGTPTNIAALPQLLLDLRAAYDDLFSRAAPVTPLTTVASAVGVSGGTFPAAAPDLSGYVLSPGIYTTAGTYGLSNTLGPLVLDAGGNPDAVFIIRSTAVGPSGLTSTTGSVVLQNGTQSKNVFWLLDNATIGAGTFFQGTVVAGHAITLLAHANVEGRMLAGALGLVSGAITLTDTNIITVPK